jgi:hypothetical protein
VIDRVLKEGASGTEVLDKVLGGKGVEFGGRGVRQTVVHLLRVLPGDDACNALREAVVNRLLIGTKASDRPGFGQIADRITDALENRGESVIGALFTPNEIGYLRTLESELAAVAPSAPTRAAAERGQSLLAQMGAFGVGGGSLGAGAGLLLGDPAAGAILGATATAAPVARNLLDRAAASAATGGGQGVPMGPAASWLRLVPGQQIGLPLAAAAGGYMGYLPGAIPQQAAGLFAPQDDRPKTGLLQ